MVHVARSIFTPRSALFFVSTCLGTTPSKRILTPLPRSLPPLSSFSWSFQPVYWPNLTQPIPRTNNPKHQPPTPPRASPPPLFTINPSTNGKWTNLITSFAFLSLLFLSWRISGVDRVHHQSALTTIRRHACNTNCLSSRNHV